MLLSFALYLATLAPSITWKFAGPDSGDFGSAVADWGVPHPTGYPLYVALGAGLVHILPFGQVAYRLNLLSAFCSAAAAGVVFLTILRLSRFYAVLPIGVRCGIAATGALALAVSRTLWSQSILAETYTLEILFAALMAWMLAGPPRSIRTILPLALLMGLSLTHHRTLVFSVTGVLLVLAARYRRTLLRPRLLGAAAVLFVLPLALYLLLPWRAAQHPATNWGDPSSLGRFVDVVMAKPYHYLLDYSPGDALVGVPPVIRLAFGQFAWWVVPLAVVGVASLWDHDRAYALYMVLVTLLCALFVDIYRAEGRERYLLQGAVMLAIGSGVGLLALAQWAQQSLLERRRRWLGVIVAVVGVVAILPWAIIGLRDFDLRHDWEAWHYAQSTLATAPRDATLFTDTDEHTFSLWYAQRAENLRPDVHVVDIRFRDPVHQR